ncbi:hypothetical protein Q2381_25510, partial [Escherichia coli]|nr:hypothetical protein [Escherichia coli]
VYKRQTQVNVRYTGFTHLRVGQGVCKTGPEGLRKRGFGTQSSDILLFFAIAIAMLLIYVLGFRRSLIHI